MGTNPTTGWKNELVPDPTATPPNSFRLVHTKPTGNSLPKVTTYVACIEVPAATQPDKVVVVDSDGSHEVALVEPSQNRQSIPCDLRTILYASKTLKLMSLDPNPLDENSKDGFHGWKVLGTKVITDEKAMQNVADAFEAAVTGYREGVAFCFFPRHAIRAEHDGLIADFVICFECCRVKAYVADCKQRSFLISSAAEEMFNRILKDSAIPLPHD